MGLSLRPQLIGFIKKRLDISRRGNLSKHKGTKDEGIDDWPEQDLPENEKTVDQSMGKNEEVSSFKHLIEKDEKIYFFIDVPPLLKNTLKN
jgi:hypothetical protein